MSEIPSVFSTDSRLHDLRWISSHMIEMIDGYFNKRMGKSGDEFSGYVKDREHLVIARLSSLLPSISSDIEDLKRLTREKISKEKAMFGNNVIRGAVEMNENPTKCDSCGKFVSFYSLETVTKFTPDNHFSGENMKVFCKKCAEKNKPVEMKEIPEERIKEVREKLRALILNITALSQW